MSDRDEMVIQMRKRGFRTISKRKVYQYRVSGRRKIEVLCGSDVAMGRLLDWMNGSIE